METYQIIFFSLSIGIFALYFIFVYHRYGIQPSISESFYAIEKRSGNLKWIFTFALWGFALPLAVVGVEVGGGFWFAAALIMFVGAAPAFKDRGMVRRVHVIGAVGGVSMAILSFIFSPQPIWGIAIALGILVLSLLKVPNKTTWIETLAFVVTWVGLLFIHLMDLP